MLKNLLTLLLIFVSQTIMAQERITLNPNEWHNVDKALKFKVNKVLSDSRCPKGAQCIWAGRVTIEIEFHHNDTVDKLAFGPTHGIGDTINILSFPVNQKDREKNFLEGFIWKSNQYRLMRVLPYPGEKGAAKFIFEKVKVKAQSKKFSHGLNDWYDVDSELKLNITGVHDSRCPEGARCSRAGEVFLDVYFQIKNQEKIGPYSFSINNFMMGAKTNKLILPPKNEDKKQTFVAFEWKDETFNLYNVLPYPGSKKTEKKFIWMRGNPEGMPTP